MKESNGEYHAPFDAPNANLPPNISALSHIGAQTRMLNTTNPGRFTTLKITIPTRHYSLHHLYYESHIVDGCQSSSLIVCCGAR
jgi:hypothetical protein